MFGRGIVNYNKYIFSRHYKTFFYCFFKRLMQHRVLRTVLWGFSFHLHLTLYVVFKNCFPMSRLNLPSFLHSFHASSAFCCLPLQRNRHVKQRLLFQNCILHDVSCLSVCVCASVRMCLCLLSGAVTSLGQCNKLVFWSIQRIVSCTSHFRALTFLACTRFLFSSLSLISYPIPL